VLELISDLLPVIGAMGGGRELMKESRQPE
jgi:hypothetical protein